MRPLRLVLDGFGSYRQPAEADFSDVDFFALTGPTGSGKSTLIDGLCFALYGTVPRWRKENVIADALAPAANECRVCLVFEAGGHRYAAVRALARDRKGQVHTRAARLDRLDPRVPASAPVSELLATNPVPLCEGPDQVTAKVEDVLGLSYRHFTQSVLLPQGRFSDFLQAEPRKRQDLLVELLAFGVYDQVGQRARERARLAADRLEQAERELAGLAAATQEAQIRAAGRVTALTRLAGLAQQKLTDLAGLRQRAQETQQRAQACRDEAGLLGRVVMPPDATGLAARIAAADKLVTQSAGLRDQAAKDTDDAQQRLAALPDRARMESLRLLYGERGPLADQVRRDEQALAAAREAEQAAAGDLRDGETAHELAAGGLADAEHAHAAVALAAGLRAGQACPVCLQPVGSLPHHGVPADLEQARAAAAAAAREVARLRSAHTASAKKSAAAAAALESSRRQASRSDAALADAPGEAEVERLLAEIAVAEQAAGQARKAAVIRRREAADAERERSALQDAEDRAWAELRRARDGVVGLGAPEIGSRDLAQAWQSLAQWSAGQLAGRRGRQPDLDAAASAAAQEASAAAAGLTRLLADSGITGLAEPDQAPAAIARHQAQAEHALAGIRRDRAAAAGLAGRIGELREQRQVAEKLGQLLRASSFERWLCSEALGSLVDEASVTLLELSGGQYRLDRDERNDLFVIDNLDAGARRPVHTLSGGETFQASLALALALSRQVVGLSAGLRDLNSVFLDEGFGTLDADTLETVATTLERLAGDSDRMVGVITHVAELAARAPVRFVVSRSGGTSAVRKERGAAE